MNEEMNAECIRRFRGLRAEVGAQLRATERARRAAGCLSFPDVCRLVGHPDAIPISVRQHIQSCKRCSDIYLAALQGYPFLKRPEWLQKPCDESDPLATAPATSSLVVRTPTAVVLMKDQEKMDREWAKVVDPHASFLRKVLEHLPAPFRYLFGMYSGNPTPPSSKPDGAAPPFDKGQHHGH